MSAYQGRREFRSGRAALALVIASELLFLAGAWFAASTRGMNLMTVVFVGMSVIGLGGIIETVRQRVVLTDDALEITRLWSKTVFARSAIETASSAKGSGTHIKLTDGRWVELPSVGNYADNSIRAWLKAPH